MAHLVFVRHGETKWNCVTPEFKKELFSSHSQEEAAKISSELQEHIGPRGIEQAKEVAKKLKNYNFDICICSPFNRAKETLSYIKKYHPNLKVILDDRIEEVDFRNHALNKKEIKYLDTHGWGKYWHESLPDKGERAITFLIKEAKEFLDDITSKYPDKNILIVSHGTRIRSMKMYLEKHKASEWSNVPHPNNCDVLEYDYNSKSLTEKLSVLIEKYLGL